MQPRDIPPCIEIIGEHRIIGPRYGSAVTQLRSAWLRLTATDAKRALVFEEVDGSRARIWGVAVTVFVGDELLRELKSPPRRWFGPELAKRLAAGEGVVLSDRQLRDANSDGGVNLLVWEACTRAEDAQRPELIKHMVSALIEAHRGFFWKEIVVGEVESIERLRTMVKIGALLWNPRERRYVDASWNDPKDLVREPHILGIARDARPEHLMSWLGTLLDYHPPQFGFSRSEQRLLTLALAGGTDRDLSVKLGISLSGVKKMWLSIYGRTAPRLPEMTQGGPPGKVWTMPSRGKEKKRRLLAYLQRHPEELCPNSQRILGSRALSAGAVPVAWS